MEEGHRRALYPSFVFNFSASRFLTVALQIEFI